MELEGNPRSKLSRKFNINFLPRLGSPRKISLVGDTVPFLKILKISVQADNSK